MKLQNKNVAQEACDQENSELPNTNPICDIMEAGNHRLLVLSQKDLETILQLALAPPQPTPELIVGFRKATKLTWSESPLVRYHYMMIRFEEERDSLPLTTTERKGNQDHAASNA